MPERIWARPDNKTWALDEIKSKVGDWFPFTSFEYVRADIVAEKDAEIERWKRHSLMVEQRAYEEIAKRDDEIAQLKKALDQATEWKHRHPDIVGQLEWRNNVESV